LEIVFCVVNLVFVLCLNGMSDCVHYHGLVELALGFLSVIILVGFPLL
jgi:hypothetical protein